MDEAAYDIATEEWRRMPHEHDALCRRYFNIPCTGCQSRFSAVLHAGGYCCTAPTRGLRIQVMWHFGAAGYNNGGSFGDW